MDTIKLKQAFYDNGSGNICGLDEYGSLYFFRDKEVIKKNDDGYEGQVGDLIYPIGWYPLTMRVLRSIGDLQEAGVKFN